MSDTDNETNGKPAAALGLRRLGNRAIGDRLRQMYDGVVEEAVPQDFLRLLDEAEAKEPAACAPGESIKE